MSDRLNFIYQPKNVNRLDPERVQLNPDPDPVTRAGFGSGTAKKLLELDAVQKLNLEYKSNRPSSKSVPHALFYSKLERSEGEPGEFLGEEAMDFELRAATAKLEREQRERKEKARKRLERERKAKAEAAIQRDAIDSARRIKRIEEARASQLVRTSLIVFVLLPVLLISFGVFFVVLCG